MRLLFRVLKEEEDAKVALPSAQEVAEYQEVVRTNFPALDGAWCVMDGLKVQFQKGREESTQNVYYNGGSMITMLDVCLYLLLLE
jgi:hypothetical protein